MDCYIDGKRFDNFKQHKQQQVLASALTEAGYHLLAKHILQQYDPIMNRGYSCIVQHYVTKNPEKIHLIEDLVSIGLLN